MLNASAEHPHGTESGCLDRQFGAAKVFG